MIGRVVWGSLSPPLSSSTGLTVSATCYDVIARNEVTCRGTVRVQHRPERVMTSASTGVSRDRERGLVTNATNTTTMTASMAGGTEESGQEVGIEKESRLGVEGTEVAAEMQTERGMYKYLRQGSVDI